MFDSTPSNLPVEPPAAPSSSLPPPPMDNFNPALALPPLSDAGPSKKVTEDIFAGLDKTPEPSSMPGSIVRPSPHASMGKAIVLAVIALVILGGLWFAGWYFFLRVPAATSVADQTGTQNPTVVPTRSEPVVETPPMVPEQQTGPIIVPPTDATIPVPTSPSDTESTSTEVVTPLLVTPAIEMTEGKDRDGDDVSDVEEDLLHTSADKQDSDGDGYPDGVELAGGYDPAAAKQALALSPFLKSLTIGSAWSVLVPTSWSLMTQNDVPGDVSLKTNTPATFDIHVASMGAAKDFSQWLSSNEPTVDATSLQPLETSTAAQAWQTKDRLTTYLRFGDSVMVVRYSSHEATTYELRALYEYVVQHVKEI